MILNVLRLIGPHERYRWVIVVIVAVTAAIAEALTAWLLYLALAAISTPSADTLISMPLVPNLLMPLPHLLLLVAFLFIARSTIQVMHAYLQRRIVENTGARLSSQLFSAYLSQPYEWHWERDTSEYIRTCHYSTQLLVSDALLPLLRLITEILVVSGLVIVLLAIQPVLTTAVFAALILVGVFVMRTVHPRLSSLGALNHRHQAISLEILHEATRAIRDLILYGYGDFVRKYTGSRRTIARTQYLRDTISELPRASLELALILLLLGSLHYVTLQQPSIDSMVATMGVFGYAGLRLQPSLHRITMALSSLRYGRTIVDAVSADLLRDETTTAQVVSTAANATILSGCGISLRAVTYRYPNSATPVISGIWLEIPPGSNIGISGPSGSGKSTLLDLLLGLLTPNEGEILIDAHPLSVIQREWRLALAVIHQHTFILNTTLQDNITMPHLGQPIDKSSLERAMACSSLYDWTIHLEDGLNTPVGEDGAAISGGQRQRIAIARAIYRQPKVLLIDEGTNALDEATQEMIVREILGLPNNPTIIWATHDARILSYMDSVVAVDAGKPI